MTEIIIWLLLAFLAICFGGVLFIGAPYVPTLQTQRCAALKLLDLKSGQVLYDLGCGDGTLLKMAAKQGIKGVGYELNPILALIAWLRTRRSGAKVRIVCGSFWKAPIGKADGIYVFLLDRYMARLDKLISYNNSGSVKLVSNAFKIPGKKYKNSKHGVYLYTYGPLAEKSQLS